MSYSRTHLNSAFRRVPWNLMIHTPSNAISLPQKKQYKVPFMPYIRLSVTLVNISYGSKRHFTTHSSGYHFSLSIMQIFNLALYGTALLATAHAAPSPMNLEVSAHKGSPISICTEVCLMICLPEKPECQKPSVSLSTHVSNCMH